MSPETSAGNAEPHVARRSVWKGTLGFGLVRIPVKLHRAVHEKRVHFHDVHDADGGRIRHRAVCSRDGAPVAREHIVHGYEIERGRDVQIAPAELDALSPPLTRTLEIDAFVVAEEIDPISHDSAYWLVPDEGGARAYALLLAAMTALGKVAIARMVLRSKQVVCVVRAAGGGGGDPTRALSLSVLYHADEIVPASALEGLPGPDEQPSPHELLLAERLVESRVGRFQPERYHDEHREKVLALVHRKAAGEAAPPAEPERTAVQLDLVGALEASVTEADRHKTAA